MSKLIVLLGLGAVTVVAFWPVHQCDFVNYDDPAYVLGNQQIRRLDPRWAFTTFYNANWHPLTWLSLQLF